MATEDDQPTPAKPPTPQVGLPRRFGIGTLMILTAVFALLCSVMKTFKADPVSFVVILIFFAGVTACQSLLFKGRNPRKASFIGGYLTGGLIFLGVAVAGGFYRQHLGWDGSQYMGILFALFVSVLLFGGLCGYLVGCVVAGIFLVWKEPDNNPSTAKTTEEETRNP